MPRPKPDCPTCDGLGWLGHDVPHGDPHFGKVYQCECWARESQAASAAIRLAHCGLEGTLLNKTFKNFEPSRQKSAALAGQVRQLVYEWTQLRTEPLLTLIGDPGTGKTHLGAAAVRWLIDHGQGAFYVPVESAQRDMRSFEDGKADAIHAAMKGAGFLVLDDLGKEHDRSGYLANQWHEVIDHRYKNLAPLLILSNLGLAGGLAELQARLGVPAVSRLREPGVGRIVIFHDPDDPKGIVDLRTGGDA